MRLRILPSTVDCTPGQGLSGYVIDGTFAIDAGPLGIAGTLEDQCRIDHILLTHSHIDHIAGLPTFLDNRYGTPAACPTVYGNKATLDSLQRDLFNDRVMPDFIGMSARMAPFLKLVELVPTEVLRIGEYTIIPYEVDHSVPTMGYVIDDGASAFGLFTDTRPIADLLRTVLDHPRLRTIFLECSFPRRLQHLAGVSYHHSTDDFLRTVRGFPSNVLVYPIHIKPQFHSEVLRELAEACVPNLRFAEPGDTVEV